MTTATQGQATAPKHSRSASGGRWRVWALAGICLASGLLYVWGIGSGSYGNSYYAAAVKSMSEGFTNFLFGSFDPYGVVTVDKPPMSLWPQVFSVWIFGYHGWSVLLPQVLEGVAAVFLLHRTVRLWAGENVALLAALLLAVTPITVAINRDNNPDTLLVLLLVASAYAFTRSVQADGRRQTTWLLWCAFFIGCAFVTKMMQAWIIVPGVALAFLVGTTSPVKRRIADLLGAGLVLFVSSFWWTALHDWWPGSKPYVGGSTDGSALELVFGYNGFGRIFGNEIGGGVMRTGELPAGMELPGGTQFPSNAIALFGGDTGVTRMFSEAVGGQISWLIPLALLVLVVVAVAGVWRLASARRLHTAKVPGDPARRAGWVLWGSWLLVTGLVFSYAQGIWHPYYTTMLAPAIAAICAAGLAVMWRVYRGPEGVGWVLLPLAVAITAGWAFVLISRDTSWHGWARWAVLAAAVLAIGGLVVGRLSERQRRVVGRPAIIAGLVAILLTPTVWSTATAAQANAAGGMPAAGPSNAMFGGRGGFPGGMSTMPSGGMPSGGMPSGGMRSGGFGGLGGTGLSEENRKILDYAKQNSGGAEITLAVEGGAMSASSFIINTDDTVIGMGGFGSIDPAPSVGQLQQWVSEGKLKFVLGGGSRGGMVGFGGDAQQERSTWIEQHCQAVDPTTYGGSPAPQQTSQPSFPGFDGSQTLYTCTA